MSNLLDDYLPEADAAAQLGVSPRTMQRWRNQANGIPHTVIGGKIYYNVASLKDWLRSQERRPNPKRAA